MVSCSPTAHVHRLHTAAVSRDRWRTDGARAPYVSGSESLLALQLSFGDGHETLAGPVVGVLVAEVGVIESGIVAATRKQRLMAAFLHNVAVVEDDDAVGVADGGEAMGDKDGGAVEQNDV